MAALLLLIPALLAACATENTTTETVIVTAAPAEAQRETIVYEELAQQITDELTRREERELQEDRLALIVDDRRALGETIEKLNIQVMVEEINQAKLVWLELQMAYLKDQIKKAAGVVERLEQAEQEGKPEVTRYEYMIVRRRVELLNGMYMDRLEKFETMKMEQFTEAALRERSSDE